MILTFEYDERGELKIMCDSEGANVLRRYLDNLINGEDTHYHLMTPEWGGNQLTEYRFDKNAKLVNQVLINLISRT